MTTVAHPFDHASTRRVLVQALCARHRAPLVDYAADLVGDERAARVVVERVFEAMLDGRSVIPTTDTARRLREDVAASLAP